MIVRYTRCEANDLANILNYLDRRSPRGALSVKFAIQRTVDIMGQNPNIGHTIAREAIRGVRVGRYPYGATKALAT
jgi:toxin ParE1/3/4